VETTGLANPKPIVDSIQETELRDEVYVDQVLAAVDSSIWTGEHYNSPTAKRQIENADTVLLTKTDLIQHYSWYHCSTFIRPLLCSVDLQRVFHGPSSA
jgi:G3E family GTPase